MHQRLFKRIKNKVIAVMSTLLITVAIVSGQGLLSNNAYAASELDSSVVSNLFKGEYAEHDYIVNNILGPYFGYGYNGAWELNENSDSTQEETLSQKPIYAVISVPLRMIVFFLISIYALYKYVHISSDTATHNSLFGKKANNVYAPLRSGVFIALLFPAGKLGYAVIQIFILWLGVNAILAGGWVYSVGAREGVLKAPRVESKKLKKQLVTNYVTMLRTLSCTKFISEGNGGGTWQTPFNKDSQKLFDSKEDVIKRSKMKFEMATKITFTKDFFSSNLSRDLMRKVYGNDVSMVTDIIGTSKMPLETALKGVSQYFREVNSVARGLEKKVNGSAVASFIINPKSANSAKLDKDLRNLLGYGASGSSANGSVLNNTPWESSRSENATTFVKNLENMRSALSSMSVLKMETSPVLVNDNDGGAF